jgi:hypothetical protein
MALITDRPGAVQSPARISRATLAILTVVFVMGAVFVVQAALPYFTLNQERFNVNGYWPRRWWLLAHITMGIVALLTGPVQLWLGLSDQRSGLHRNLGLVYMASVVLSAAAAYYLALNTGGGIGFGFGLAGLATAWLLTTAMAFVAIKRQLYDQHKEWMIRSYVVTTGFVTFRVLFPLLQGSGIGSLPEQLAVAAWGCWAVPLLITEAVLQGRKILFIRT